MNVYVKWRRRLNGFIITMGGIPKKERAEEEERDVEFEERLWKQ